MVSILYDADVRHYLTPGLAVEVIEAVFLARALGHTNGSPRWELPFPEGRLTFTVGAVPESVGFRAYVRGQYQHDDQVVVVWDRETGALKGIIIGEAIGVMRTGAIGGLAVKMMTPPNVGTLALIGTGRQALSQLLAIASVRRLGEVRVFSRSDANRRKFCDDVKKLLPTLNIFPTESAEMAIREADMVVGATTSKSPVILGEWLKSGAYVATLGTKGRNTREVDEAVVARAGWVVTDSPEQTRNYADGTILDGTDHPLVDLADVVAGKTTAPQSPDITLFLSAGLAGTEVALATHVLALNQLSK